MSEEKGVGGRGRPVDEKTRAKLIAEAREGKLGRNALAKKYGVSVGSVTKYCAEAVPPVKFDRAQTAAAVKAHQIDMKGERAKISEKAVAQVHRLFSMLDSPHEVFNFDKDGGFSTAWIEKPTSMDVKNYATSIGILIDKHLVLVKHDTDDQQLAAVDAWNAHIAGEPEKTPEGWE